MRAPSSCGEHAERLVVDERLVGRVDESARPRAPPPPPDRPLDALVDDEPVDDAGAVRGGALVGDASDERDVGRRQALVERDVRAVERERLAERDAASAATSSEHARASLTPR